MIIHYFNFGLLLIIIILLSQVISVANTDRELTAGDSIYGYLKTTAITPWLTAQQNCVNWGGNLATIKSSLIDTLLYYLADNPDQLDCWIGLNDRDTEALNNGSEFVWISGSNNTYRNFATTPVAQPDDLAGYDDCVGFRFNQSDGWHELNCDTSSTCYFCNKPRYSRGCDMIYDGSCYRAFEVSDGINFLDSQFRCEVWGGDLTSATSHRESNLLYKLVPDEIVYWWIGLYDKDEVLEWSEEIVLNYTKLKPVYTLNSKNGLWMNTSHTTKMNGYICERTASHIAVEGSTYIYTVGVDREDVLLLCDSFDGSYNLSVLTWHVKNGANFTNPLNFISVIHKLPTQITEIECRHSNGTTALKSFIKVQGPPVISLTSSSKGAYTLLPPETNTAKVSGSFGNVVLRTNLIGRWLQPDLSYITSNSITFVSLNARNQGLYKFYITDWNRNEVLAIKIIIANIAPTLGCDFLYEGYCHNFYPVTTNVNWFEAQASCVARGGNLSSITNKEQQDQFNTIINETYNRCWIGLNDIEIEENTNSSLFVWVDGRVNSNTYFSPNEPSLTDSETKDCTIFRDPIYQDRWATAVCSEEYECYFCEKPIPRFGRIINESIYEPLNGNELLFTNETLFCVPESRTDYIFWKYRPDLSDIDIASYSTPDSTLQLSTLRVNITQPGYYICEIRDGTTTKIYKVGVYDITQYTVAQAKLYNYTLGVDRQDIFLFCFGLKESDEIPNGQHYYSPLNIYEYRELLMQYLLDEFICYDFISKAEILRVVLKIQGPPVITLTYATNYAYTLLPPHINTAAIAVLTDNVILQIGLRGKWVLPDNTNTTNGRIETSVFTVRDGGLYRYYIENWDGQEVIAIQVNISPVGTNFAEKIPSGYKILSNNAILYENTTLVCATNDTSQQIEWKYLPTQNSSFINMTSFSSWNSTIGISTLDILSSQIGYYSCEIVTGGGLIIYTAAVFVSEEIIVATDGVYYFTRGVDLFGTQLLCITDSPSIALRDVVWKSTNMTYNNPLDYGSLENGDYTLVCSGGSLSLAKVSLLIQEPPAIRLVNTEEETHSLLSPNINTAEIRVLSQNVTLQATSTGTWQRPDNTNSSDNLIQFSVFTSNMAGLYRFFINSCNSGEVLSIQIAITVTGTVFAEYTPPSAYTVLNSNTVFLANKQIVCATSNASQIIHWNYQPTQEANKTNVTTATWDATTRISMIAINKQQQGYYQCNIVYEGASVVYSVAIFDPYITTVLTNVTKNLYYTKDIDPVDTQILCVANNSQIPLNKIRIRGISTSYQNPLLQNQLNTSQYTLTCDGDGVPSHTGSLLVQGPVATVLNTSVSSEVHSTKSPAVSNADITVLTSEVRLDINLVGRWKVPNNCKLTNSSIEIPVFTPLEDGLYSFYVTSWNGSEKLAFQIQMNAVGTKLAELTLQGYRMIGDNTILYANSRVVCATNDTSQIIQWYNVSTQTGNETNLTSLTNWNNRTGISILEIEISQQGYYSCVIMTGSRIIVYTTAVFDPSVTIVATNGTYTYTKGIDPQDIQLLCVSNNSEIQLSNVKWNSSEETYDNPIKLYSLTNMNYTLHCYGDGRTLVTVSLLVQDQPSAKLIENSTSLNYTLLPPLTNEASIHILSQKVTLHTELFGRWQNYNGTYTSSLIVFQLFTANSIGLYSFYVTSWNGTEVVAIQIMISAIGTNLLMTKNSGLYCSLPASSVLYSDVKLICATNDTSDRIQWTHQLSQNSTATDVTINSNWNSSTFVSTLSLIILQQGYYTCIAGVTEITFALFDPTSTISVGMQSDSLYFYTTFVDPANTQLLCVATQSTDVLSIKWMDGVTAFDNPIILNELQLFNGTLTCDTGNARPVTVSLTVEEYTPSNTRFTEETDGTCFWSRSERLSWDEANRICSNYDGGSLVDISSTDINRFVSQQIFDGVERYWIGIRFNRSSNEAQYVNGDIVEGSGSASLLPNISLNPGEDCVAIDWEGNWYFHDCEVEILSYICAKDAAGITPCYSGNVNCWETSILPASLKQSCESLKELGESLDQESDPEESLLESLMSFNLLPGVPITIFPFPGAVLVIFRVVTTKEQQVPISHNKVGTDPQTFPDNTVVAVLSVGQKYINKDLGRDNATEKEIISDVITSVSSRNLTGNLSLTFQLSDNNKETSGLKCYFLDPETDLWSSEGIITIILSDDSVQCVTNHLTTFAVLFTTSKREKTHIETMILRVLSYSILSMSLLFLFTSLVIFIIGWKKFFNSDISFLHFNHTLVLFLALACFTFGIETTSSVYWLCTGIAFSLHFLWTNVFMASLCIGILLLYKLNSMDVDYKDKFSSFLVLISWSASFLWALAWFIYARFEGEYIQEDTIGANETKLVKLERSCFLSMTGNIIWAFIAPIVLIIGINLVILFLAMVKLRIVNMKGCTDLSEFLKLRQAVLGGLLLVPVLSLPFIVALPLMFSRFYQGGALDLMIQIFEWIFIIVNAPIGIYHFFTITIQRKDVIEFLLHAKVRSTRVYTSYNTRDTPLPFVFNTRRNQANTIDGITVCKSNSEPSPNPEEIEGTIYKNNCIEARSDFSSSEYETRL